MRKEKLLKLQKRTLRYYLNCDFYLEMGSQKKRVQKTNWREKMDKVKNGIILGFIGGVATLLVKKYGGGKI